jgi:DNA-directed RNA polymerase specialized sigma24 family protein
MSGFANVTGQPVQGDASIIPLSISTENSYTTRAMHTAFEVFVSETRVGLTRAISAHHHPQLASDLVAEAYAWAWANWDRVEAMRNPGGYLFRLADRLGTRRAMKADREPSTDPAMLTVQPWFDSTVNPDIAHLLSGLPPRQRAAVLLIHAYEYTYREAGEILDVPVTTITNDVIRGVKALRLGSKP